MRQKKGLDGKGGKGAVMSSNYSGHSTSVQIQIIQYTPFLTNFFNKQKSLQFIYIERAIDLCISGGRPKTFPRAATSNPVGGWALTNSLSIELSKNIGERLA